MDIIVTIPLPTYFWGDYDIIRNKQVMIDKEIAETFNVTTKGLNEQVKEILTDFRLNFAFN